MVECVEVLGVEMFVYLLMEGLVGVNLGLGVLMVIMDLEMLCVCMKEVFDVLFGVVGVNNYMGFVLMVDVECMNVVFE